jgi:hypothetical protein
MRMNARTRSANCATVNVVGKPVPVPLRQVDSEEWNQADKGNEAHTSKLGPLPLARTGQQHGGHQGQGDVAPGLLQFKDTP